jgi:alkylhydroperoxidase/carboxymuconolactone decarboxylase family protein YurZ
VTPDVNPVRGSEAADLDTGSMRFLDPEQLRSHLRRALDNGLGTDELAAAMTHLAFYAGWPAGMTGATELKKITEE